MNYFGNSQNHNSESQETPFFNKQKRSLFDEESQRAQQFQAFDFFNAHDGQVKRSILSQLQNDYQSEIEVEKNRKINQKIYHQQGPTLNLNFQEPFSFQPQIQLVAPFIKQKAVNQQKNNQNQQSEVIKKDKELKWKKTSFLSLETNSEPLKFQNKKNRFQQLKNHPPIQQREVILQKKLYKEAINFKQDIQKNTHKNEKTRNSKFKLFQEGIKKRKQNSNQPQLKQIQPQNKDEKVQKNLISKSGQKNQSSSNINVNSDFSFIKGNELKTITSRDIPGNYRFRKMSPKKLPSQKEHSQKNPQMNESGDQKKCELSLHLVEVLKKAEASPKKDVKIEEKGDYIQTRSAKNNLFLSEERQFPPKLSRFSLALKSKSKDSLSSEENMKPHQTPVLGFQQTVNQCESKANYDSIFSNSKHSKLNLSSQIVQEDIPKQTNVTIQLSEEKKQIKREGLKEQLRKFGGRPTEKFEIRNLLHNVILKQPRNKQKASQPKQIMSYLIKQTTTQLKQKPVLFQITKKQKKKSVQQLDSLELKQKQIINKDQKQTIKEEAQNLKMSIPQGFPKMDTSRSMSSFVRSMMMLMQVATEAQKLRQRVREKKNMFTELIYQEKRMRKKLDDLLERTKHK